MRFLIFNIFLFATLISIGQQNDESLIAKDLTISIGAGKNKFFEEREFELTAPLEVPTQLNLGLSKKLEIGLEWSPIIFNDRFSYNIFNSDSLRSVHKGGINNGIFNIQYSMNNNYRMNGYIQAGGGYTYLHKKQWIIGDLNELIGEGYNWSIGGGLRYQLGNIYDDVFPWFFDVSLAYTRFNINITEFSINEVLEPKESPSWQDLNFGSIDVLLRFGYRFRVK